MRVKSLTLGSARCQHKCHAPAKLCLNPILRQGLSDVQHVLPSLQGWISPITFFFFAMFYDPQVVSFVFCCTLGTYHVKCSYWGFLQSKNARWMDGRSHIFRKNITGQVFTLTPGQQNTLIPYVNSNSQSGSWCPIFIDNICSPNGRKRLL